MRERICLEQGAMYYIVHPAYISVLYHTIASNSHSHFLSACCGMMMMMTLPRRFYRRLAHTMHCGIHISIVFQHISADVDGSLYYLRILEHVFRQSKH